MRRKNRVLQQRGQATCFPCSVDSSLTITFHCDPDLSRTELADEFIAGKRVGARGGKTARGATDGDWTDATRLLAISPPPKNMCLHHRGINHPKAY
jgi:hypothetical protein